MVDYNYPLYGMNNGMGMGDPLLDLMPPMRKDRDDYASIGIIRELSPKKIIETLRHNLVGEFYDTETKKWERVAGFTPMLNELGRAKYLQIVSSAVTDIVTFSNYQDDQVARLVKYIMRGAIPDICVNYKLYGIKNKSDISSVLTQLFNLVLGSFNKAIGAGDRGVIGRTISEQIHTNQIGNNEISPIDSGAGFYSKLNPFLRGRR